MKPIIGVLLRKEITKEENEVMVLYQNIYQALKHYGATVIGIDTFDSRVLSLCDGLVGQGGDDIRFEDKEIILYAYQKEIPFLGICLGMQEMGVFFDGTLGDFKDSFHKQIKDYVHEVTIKKDSFLYQIVGKEKIKVNSRHKSFVEKTSLSTCATYDHTIEAIEDKTKPFFLGVQWHPEAMISYDEDADKILSAFVKACENRDA